MASDAVKEPDLAGEPIMGKLTQAPGSRAPTGGLKVVARNGWFAARLSGIKAAYKVYAESFKDERQLKAILTEAQHIVGNAQERVD